MNNIQTKLIVIYSVFLTLGVIGIIYILINKQNVDGMVIGLEEKQQMLAQEVSANEFIISKGIGSKESIEHTINLLDRTLKDLNSVDIKFRPISIKNKKIQKRLSQKQKVRFIILLKLLSESKTM